MIKKEAEQLITILVHEKFLTTKCKSDTYLGLVRNQIALEPIKEELDKARKTAREKYATEELKELEKQMQEEGVSEQLKSEYYIKVSEFSNNMTAALEPILDQPADITLEKMSASQFEQVRAANETWLDLKTITVLYKYLVDTSKPEA